MPQRTAAGSQGENESGSERMAMLLIPTALEASPPSIVLKVTDDFPIVLFRLVLSIIS